MDHETTTRPGGSIQVLARTAAILRALESNRDGLTIAELAQATQLPRPTVQRIVLSFCQEGMLCNTGRGRRYGLGPELLRLALSVHLDLATVLQPVMDALSNQVEETVNLLVQNGSCAVCIAHSYFLRELQVAPQLGGCLPLHASASGKAMLAAMPDERAQQSLGRAPWPKLTEKTRQSWPALREELEQTRMTGIAFDAEEYAEGVAAVAVPVATLCGKLHALAIPAPIERLKSKHTQLEKALLAAKTEADRLIHLHRI